MNWRFSPWRGNGAVLWWLLLPVLSCSLPAAAAPQAPSPQAASKGQASPRSSASSSPLVDLRPKLVPGEVLVYQIQLQTITDTKRTGAVSDPQGPSRLAVTWDATVKLEVLGQPENAPAPAPPPQASAGKSAAAKSNALSVPIRVRTTYVHSVADVRADSPDPQAEDIEQRYSRLEGQVLEFAVGTDGRVSDVHGLENVLDNDQVRQAAEQWMAQVSAPAMVSAGVALGQSWNSAQPAVSMPLADMIWRSNSSYVRNENCPSPGLAPASSSPELCAVILTRQSIQPRKLLRDPTPDDYRRNGLRTSGHWTGSGESLSYLSLQTHAAVSVTQDSTQQIDFTVTNASGNSIRYAGTIETHSRVALLPPDGGGPR